MNDWAEHLLYRKELNEYLDKMEEEYMDKFGEEEFDCVEWNKDAWINRDKTNYSIVSCMAGCILEKGEEKHFLEMVSNLGAKHPALIIGTAITLPDLEDRDHPLPESGGRHDLFFAFHNLDIGRVAIPRLMYGIRWWSDVVDNEWNRLPLKYKADYREHTIYQDFVFETIEYGENEIKWGEEE